MCSCSGPLGADNAIAKSVVEAWAKTVNANGGLAGHQVDLVEEDTASNPGKAATAGQALVSAGVQVIIDADILSQVWEKTVDQAKIPVVGGAFNSDEYFADPNWYPSGETNDSIVVATVAVAKQAGVTKMAHLYCAEAPQCQQSVAPVKAAAKSMGLSIPYVSSVSATAPNYTAQCVAAKQSGADGIFIGDAMEINARIAADCDKQGYDPIYVTEGTGFTNLGITGEGLSKHLWASFPILPYFSHAPAVQAMNAAVDKYFPGARQKDTWSEFAVQTWTGGLLLQQAVKNAKITPGQDVTSADIRKGLDATSHTTLGGFSPTLTFSPGKAHKVDCWFVGKVVNGVASQVGGLKCEHG